ncbi:hypothetical protein BU25DRAFT_177440 [Macroventuria anomochaeta]|uniref:Uncharacterized protein n=1 Tax=Macroventuria anomochaeta TaxID=301207 RepID=A0ACB6RQX6_9PLEO|nr:uncharacterized protein BU25DRAFT_177440 [Macroventuria anomochaeta]KAF2623332.1 hypothetical protein BU25DRAFT_177440 [Macroventuria anomochaeta]
MSVMEWTWTQREVDRQALIGQLRTQSLGSVIGPLGLDNLRVVKENLSCLRDEGASLTCVVARGSQAGWFLTRESGELPVCYDAKGCGCDQRRYTSNQLRRSYLVLKVGVLQGREWRDHVAVALLSEEAVCVAEAVARSCCQIVGGGGDAAQLASAMSGAFRALDDGAFSSGGGYSCRLDFLCKPCSEVPRKRRQFIWLVRFIGVRPWGEKHWFGGVTLAVGDVCPAKEPWLRCRLIA